MKKYVKYPNLLAFLAILIVMLAIRHTSPVLATVTWIGSLGILGIVLTGFFLVSTFTVVPATVVLVALSAHYDLATMAIAGAFGSMLGEFVMLHLFRERIYEELKELFSRVRLPKRSQRVQRILNKYIHPVLGALVLISPLPDEVGIALMGISDITPWQFGTLMFFLDGLNILLLVIIFR